MKELKLKRRELRIDVYGEEQILRFPTALEHDEYTQALMAEGSDQYKATEKLVVKLGMSKASFKILEQPDLMELVTIITGQKKI